MQLCSTTINEEVGIKFHISHKVHKVMMRYLTEDIMKPYGLSELEPNVFLNLQQTTRESFSELSVSKRSEVVDDFLTWELRLPYKKINDSDSYLESYLEYFFLGAAEVFSSYGVSNDAVFAVKERVEKEVLGKEEYEYVETYTSKVDTSKYDF